MEHVLALMQVIRAAFMEECLPAGRTKEQVEKRDRWKLRVPPRYRFEWSNIYTV